MADTPTPERGARGATGKTGARGRSGKAAVTPDAYLRKADELQKSLNAVRREMQRQTDEIEAANRTATDANKSARRSKWASRFALVGVALALVGLVRVQQQNFALERQNDRIEAQQAEIVASRAEARHAVCARANRTREEAGNAGAAKAIDFIQKQKDYTHAPPSTGALLAAEQAYIESQRQETLKVYDKFDCTPAGIEAAYKNPPPDPYANDCVPDGKGLCVTTTTPTAAR